MLGWAEEHKINLIHILPERPMQNGHMERFHGCEFLVNQPNICRKTAVRMESRFDVNYLSE
jgi:transposase InsO family protein